MSMDIIHSHEGIIKSLPPGKRKAYRERVRYWRHKGLSPSDAHQKAAGPILSLIRNDAITQGTFLNRNLPWPDRTLETEAESCDSEGLDKAGLPQTVSRILRSLPLFFLFLCVSSLLIHASYKASVIDSQFNGSYYIVGKDDPNCSDDVIYIAEGLATAYSIYMATGNKVAVAISAHNLKAVAKAMTGFL